MMKFKFLFLWPAQCQSVTVLLLVKNNPKTLFFADTSRFGLVLFLERVSSQVLTMDIDYRRLINWVVQKSSTFFSQMATVHMAEWLTKVKHLLVHGFDTPGLWYIIGLILKIWIAILLESHKSWKSCFHLCPWYLHVDEHVLACSASPLDEVHDDGQVGERWWQQWPWVEELNGEIESCISKRLNLYYVTMEKYHMFIDTLTFLTTSYLSSLSKR